MRGGRRERGGIKYDVRENKSTLCNAPPCDIIISQAPLINDDIVDIVASIIIIIVTTFLINEKIEILRFCNMTMSYYKNSCVSEKNDLIAKTIIHF